jgi:uncharacterized membrane protein
VRADIEYEVNIKAELEIAHLHEKTDRMYSEMLEYLTRAGKTHRVNAALGILHHTRLEKRIASTPRQASSTIVAETCAALRTHLDSRHSATRAPTAERSSILILL